MVKCPFSWFVFLCVFVVSSQFGKDAEVPESLFVADGLETTKNSPVRSNSDRDLLVAGEFGRDQMTVPPTE